MLSITERARAFLDEEVLRPLHQIEGKFEEAANKALSLPCSMIRTLAHTKVECLSFALLL